MLKWIWCHVACADIRHLQLSLKSVAGMKAYWWPYCVVPCHLPGLDQISFSTSRDDSEMFEFCDIHVLVVDIYRVGELRCLQHGWNLWGRHWNVSLNLREIWDLKSSIIFFLILFHKIMKFEGHMNLSSTSSCDSASTGRIFFMRIFHILSMVHAAIILDFI